MNEVCFRPSIAPTIVDIKIIINVKIFICLFDYLFISIKYDININGAAFWIVISSAQFSHLIPSITPGNHQ
jgi:hypothetical protein